MTCFSRTAGSGRRRTSEQTWNRWKRRICFWEIVLAVVVSSCHFYIFMMLLSFFSSFMFFPIPNHPFFGNSNLALAIQQTTVTLFTQHLQWGSVLRKAGCLHDRTPQIQPMNPSTSTNHKTMLYLEPATLLIILSSLETRILLLSYLPSSAVLLAEWV